MQVREGCLEGQDRKASQDCCDPHTLASLQLNTTHKRSKELANGLWHQDAGIVPCTSVFRMFLQRPGKQQLCK